VKEMGSGLETRCACTYDSDIEEIRAVVHYLKERYCSVSDFESNAPADGKWVYMVDNFNAG